MALSLRDCSFYGPALPEPFVKFELERHLAKLSPLLTGPALKALAEPWETYRRRLRNMGESGGEIRVFNHVIEPLAPLLGYTSVVRDEKVRTREGDEDGGYWLSNGKSGLRAWTIPYGVDLDAPNRRGRAYRFSHARIAGRVLLAKGERLALLTDGSELRLLFCDPARPDSHLTIALGRTGGWVGARELPDSFRLLLALACPRGVAAIPDLVEAARLSQATVTKKLREQARLAVAGFLQGVLDDPRNQSLRAAHPNPAALSRLLWEEGLVLIYRLLFVFKMESSPDPARAFSFANTSVWRNSYSPNIALASVVRAVLDTGAETGAFLEESLRTLFRLFSDGLSSSELNVSPLGGALFGKATTPTLDTLAWGERSVARLLDALLWTPGDGKTERERVHYGSLDVEDLGRVYEALLELEPGISTEAMSRLRRAKLEVVVPAAQAAPYRANAPTDDDVDDDVDEEDAPKKGKTKVAFVEDIPAGRFFLRTGLGRKSSGSYYTPHPFVRFLVQETLGPQIAERSPPSDPHPARILSLKVLDPAMGSGHFLVEACRYLGDALYEACRLCDERAATAEESGNPTLAAEFRARVQALPDPNDELLAWLPSRAPEGTTAGHSQRRAEALCRRLVAVHSLYGVDKNRLAVELAKLSLWLESYAEGLPLTFMDHRLICGDSLTGPFLDHLFTWPLSATPIQDDLLSHGLRDRLSNVLTTALLGVRDLTASIGKDIADLERKATAKSRLDAALDPFRTLAAAWSGIVMLAEPAGDNTYRRILDAVAAGVAPDPTFQRILDVGQHGVVYDLVFPEVFHPDGGVERTGGFDAVVGNPPWDTVEVAEDAFWGALDLRALEVDSRVDRAPIIADIRLSQPDAVQLFDAAEQAVSCSLRYFAHVYQWQSVASSAGVTVGRPDFYRVFAEKSRFILRQGGVVGLVLPSAFHCNEGATGLRRLFLYQSAIRFCYSFENRRKLFEIDGRMKFDLLVATADAIGTNTFKAMFYMLDPQVLFSEKSETLQYSRRGIEALGGPLLTFPEVRDSVTSSLLEGLALAPTVRFGDTTWLQTRNGIELHRSPNLNKPVAYAEVEATVEVLEGKCVTQFSDRTEIAPKVVAPLSAVIAEPRWARTLRFHKLAYRAVASSTNERTIICAFLRPNQLVNHSLLIEATPELRPNVTALCYVALMNTFTLDWQARQKVDKNVSAFIVRELRFPILTENITRFLAHSALRLSCNHAGYAPLWIEQLGTHWRETTPENTWPVLPDDNARWAVRAAIDAVVADAYGLTRAQYAHVLGSFSHKSYPKAPERCLAAFDALKEMGMEAFVRKEDPYWDVAVVETLPVGVGEKVEGELFGRAGSKKSYVGGG